MPLKDVQLGTDVLIFQPDLVNLYGCYVGDETRIGPFVEIQAGVRVGKKCKISSHSFICEGVEIEDGVFIGHGVMFTNDKYPRALNPDGSIKGGDDWELERSSVGKGASIGSNATILPGVRIGENAMIAAGAVVISDVPPNTIAAGVPCKIIGPVA